MQRSTFRLSRLFQSFVYVACGLLLASGGGWMLAQEHRGEAAWDVLPLLMKVHGGAAMLALLVLGALTPHVQRGWRARQNRLTGGLLAAVLAFLVVSGYGLYYAGGEEFRAWLSRWHGWVGLAVAVLLPLHAAAGQWLVRQSRSRKPQLARSDS